MTKSIMALEFEIFSLEWSRKTRFFISIRFFFTIYLIIIIINLLLLNFED